MRKVVWALALSWGWLSAVQAGPELARRLEDKGVRVRGGSRVEGHLPQGGSVTARIGSGMGDEGPQPPAPPPDPQRAYHGERLDLANGAIVERLTFADPQVALELADQLLDPSQLQSGPQPGQAVVEVRGRHVVVVRCNGPSLPLIVIAQRVMPEVWASGGAAADSPRAYLGLRDERGVAVESARRGPLEEQVGNTLEKGRARFPTQGEPGSPLRWENEDRTALHFRASDGTIVTLDASGTPAVVVTGSRLTHPYVKQDLERLKQALPARNEDAATTAAIARGEAPSEQGQPVSETPAPPEGVGLQKSLGALGEAMGGGPRVERTITAPIR